MHHTNHSVWYEYTEHENSLVVLTYMINFAIIRVYKLYGLLQ